MNSLDFLSLAVKLGVSRLTCAWDHRFQLLRCPQRQTFLRFSDKCMHAKSLQSCLTLFSLWTVACQFPLPFGFSRQEYWGRLPCPPGDLPDPGIEPTSLTSPALASCFFTYWATGEALLRQDKNPNHWLKETENPLFGCSMNMFPLSGKDCTDTLKIAVNSHSGKIAQRH